MTKGELRKEMLKDVISINAMQRWTRKMELLKEADFTQGLNCQSGLLLTSVPTITVVNI